MTKLPDQLYQERLKRVEDAIRLNVPDRVPLFASLHFLPAKYAGLCPEEAFYQTDRWFEVNKNMILDLEPDIYLPPTSAVYPGRSLDLLKCRQVKWPGHGTPARSTYQFNEGEYMKEDEYDAFLADPSDFLIRTYVPRIFETLEPLQHLPSLEALFIQGYKTSVMCAVFADQKIAGAFEALRKASLEAMRYMSQAAQFDKEMRELGFPPGLGSALNVPFDYISDMLRGMRGTMIDMYRQPKNLLAAMDRILPPLLKAGVAAAKRIGNPRVFIALHRGADGFMSLKQFETFYWPGLKEIILALIDEGLTPCPFFEGDYTTRLKYLKEFPKGKVLPFFDATDIFKVKEILGDTLCIAGNMPLSLLQTGTPKQVRDYTKKLIDVVGRGGGFVMSSRTVLDDAEPELVKIWVDFTREYGVYR